MNHPPNQVREDINDEEISLKDSLLFLVGSWKIILGSGLAGLMLSLGYLWIVPSKWEASAQIQMAQMGSSSNANQSAVSVEDANLLISRMKIPTSYDESIIQACGMKNKSNAAETLASAVKITQAKGVNSVVELRIALYSKEDARNCAESLYQFIKKSQENIAAPFVQEALRRMDGNANSIKKIKEVIHRVEVSGGALSVAYFATRDEIKYLTEEITNMKNFLTLTQQNSTKLLAPVYVSGQSIYPRKGMSIFAGFLAGLFFGVLLSFIPKFQIKYKDSKSNSISPLN